MIFKRHWQVSCGTGHVVMGAVGPAAALDRLEVDMNLIFDQVGEDRAMMVADLPLFKVEYEPTDVSEDAFAIWPLTSGEAVNHVLKRTPEGGGIAEVAKVLLDDLTGRGEPRATHTATEYNLTVTALGPVATNTVT